MILVTSKIDALGGNSPITLVARGPALNFPRRFFVVEVKLKDDGASVAISENGNKLFCKTFKSNIKGVGLDFCMLTTFECSLDRLEFNYGNIIKAYFALGENINLNEVLGVEALVDENILLVLLYSKNMWSKKEILEESLDLSRELKQKINNFVVKISRGVEHG